MSTLLKKMMVSFFAFFMAILLAEIALRIFWINPYQKTQPAKVVELRLFTPLLNRTLDRKWLDPAEPRVLFRSDEIGYITPSNQFANPDYTIAFLGGSTTECRYVKENLRFPALVSDLLKDKGYSVNILNAGRSGNTLHDSINNYFNQVLLDKPDIVVLMHAINDHGLLAKDPNYASRSGQLVDAHKQLKWLLLDLSINSSLFGLLREIEYWLVPREVGMLTSSMGHPVDLTPFVDRLEMFVAMVQSFGAVPVLMTQPLAEAKTELTPEWADTFNQRRFNDAIRSVAASRSIPLVDLEQRVLEVSDYSENPLKYLYDGIHVTDIGSEVYAQEIASILAPLIKNIQQKAATRFGGLPNKPALPYKVIAPGRHVHTESLCFTCKTSTPIIKDSRTG